MPAQPLRFATSLALAFALGLATSIAHAQVYKCQDGTGKTTYSDMPCDAASKPLRLADPSKASATDPNMCAQLLDELNRLAADADRSAKGGHKQPSYGTKHRRALTRQYEARCVGMSRSEPKPK